MRTMTAKAAESAKAQAGPGASGSPATGPAGRRGGSKSMGVQNLAGWLFSTPSSSSSSSSWRSRSSPHWR